MKKIYDFDYDYCEADARFEVDTEIFTEEHAQQTLNFFLWDNDYDHDADPIDEVLKKYAIEAIRSATFNNYNEKGVISDFNDKEGYCRIDGSDGIKLISVSKYELDEEKLSVKIKTS